MKLCVNGRALEVPDGSTLLHATRRAGIEVPTLCHDDRLRPAGACRLCLVRVRGMQPLVPACATIATDGMEVETHTPEIEETRRTLLQLLAEDYPTEAVERWPEKPFHRWLEHYSIRVAADVRRLTSDQSLLPSAAKRFLDKSHPCLAADMTRCIDCFRCVRICAEVQGQFVWHVIGPGHDARIVPDGPTLLSSSCVSCGACVDTCPTGALEDQSVLRHGPPAKWTRTTCPYCGVGCELNVGTREGRIVQVKPVPEAPVSKGHLCVKGRYAFDFTHAEDRVTEPMVREDAWLKFRASRNQDDPFPLTPALSLGEKENRSLPLGSYVAVRKYRALRFTRRRRDCLPLPEGEGWGEGEGTFRPPTGWCVVSWPEAIQFVADTFRRILEETGPDSLGVLGSARGTNEENYLAQKFARVVLGTNNVDCCARVCHAPTAAGMRQTLGTGAATNSFDDIECAAAFVLCGCNPTENHPIVGARIKQAVLCGAKLIVIDPREIELARHADLHLQLRPGTNIPLLNGIAHVLVAEGLTDQAALRDRVSDWAVFVNFIASWPPERAAAVTGVGADDIRAAARLYAGHKPAMCFHGLGVTEHVQGTDSVMCLVNLALLTGNFGRPGAGVNPLRGQNNVQGAAHMGCEPGHLTGFVPLDQGRGAFEAWWRAPVPRSPGLNLMQMIDAAASQNLKALWAIGYDVALTNPDSNATKAALAKLDFIVVQDLFLNELARGFGHVFLPACSSFEKDGTFMNSERRVQRVRRVIEPMGHSKPDWEIICEVAKTLQRSAGFRPGASEDTERAGSETARVKTGHSEFMDDDRTPPSRTHLISTGLQPGDLAAKAIPAASAASSRPVKAVETALTPADGNTGLKPGANENPDSPAGYESLPRPASRGDGCSGFDFRSPEEIWNEVRAVWKAGAGIRYARLEHAGLQWPCPDEAHPGTTILHTQSFPHGPRAALQPVEFRPTAETPTAEFPLLLTTGRTLYQFNAGTMTRRTPNATLRGSDTLDIAPADAERLALRDGDRVRVCSRHGEAVMPVRLDPRVKPGELFATFHAAEIFLNQLTSPHRDRVVMTPEYKVVAVRVEKSG